MCEKRYIVKLTKDEREQLNELIRKGKSPAKRQLKGRILLKADEAKGGPGWNDTQIAAPIRSCAPGCVSSLSKTDWKPF